MSLSVPLLPPTALIFSGLQEKMRQTWAPIVASKHKTRYATPQQPENPANGGLILTACRLIRLSLGRLHRDRQRVEGFHHFGNPLQQPLSLQ